MRLSAIDKDKPEKKMAKNAAGQLGSPSFTVTVCLTYVEEEPDCELPVTFHLESVPQDTDTKTANAGEEDEANEERIPRGNILTSAAPNSRAAHCEKQRSQKLSDQAKTPTRIKQTRLVHHALEKA
jgi:hypothetical protein